MPGPKKNWTAWRRVHMARFKKKCKKKNTEVNQYARGTGGGPPLNPTFTKEEESILNILEKVKVEGDENIKESCDIVEVEPVASIKPSTSKLEEKQTERAATKRFTQTAEASKRIGDILQMKCNAKAVYYEDKLRLLERDVVAKENIAKALEQLAGHFCK
ncbi:hypothetical protein RI129_002919 [Pyrocoelia pectoralis]|uniref:Uncharacterized protein n=1 Tax=Pyrocoelia pectoralis TaxID=417401 RepID=A0AAN7VHB7_9COLE